MNGGYESVSVDLIKPHPDNPRRGDIDRIAKSIKANGFYGAVIVQRSTGHICGGNHRYLAALQVGMTEIPVLWLDVDDATARRILIADNRTSDVATYDDEALAELLRLAQADGGIDGTGYEFVEVEDFLAGLGPPPDIDELSKELGDPEDSDFWPVLRFKVPPHVRDRFAELTKDLGGEDADHFAYLLDCTDAWRSTSTEAGA